MPDDFPIMFTRPMLNRLIMACRAQIALRTEHLKQLKSPAAREPIEKELSGYKADLQKLERAKSPF